MIVLHSSYVRCASITLALVLLAVNLGHVQSITPLDRTLLIPIILVPNAVWVMFVPRTLEYSESQLRIRSWFRRERIYVWQDLECYGPGRGAYILRFKAHLLEQIFSLAYPQREWNEFIAFIQNRYPDRKLKWWQSGLRW